MLKLKSLFLGVLAAGVIATGVHAQTVNGAIEQLPIRTLSHVLGHDSGGFVGREPVTDFLKPGTIGPVQGHIATWGASGNLITDGGALGTAATQNTGTSGATVPLLNGVNTWSGAQTIPTLNINGAAGAGTRVQHFQTSGVDRFVFGLDNGSESGSNVGSNAFFNSYSDAGGFLSTVWSVNRSTGVMNISNLTLSNPLPITSGGTGATSAGAAQTALGLGSMATQSAGSVAITGGSITGITDLAVADGGTGASTAANARTNLSAAASGANSDITSLSNLTTPISIAQGGTAGATASAARTNLGLTAAATATASVGGSWTPILAFGGGSTGITYSTQSGTWQRIGPFIYVSFTITLTSKGSSTGAATVSGLPIATSSGGSLLIVAGSNFVTQSPTFGVIAAGTTSASIGVAGSTGPVALTDTNFSATTSLTMSGVYTNGAF
ncbi:hypothetical protein [Rhizobium lusitanum]|uniref:hypothetical protein n=1 Tax=Rhizobium lusitanum TaxID=293958 RepID=UPI00195CA353|nr:hypothetical protein [Rhizobium lusitanum]MBM7045456.1 hypothetical protein [Rhizobium lusitanum]